MNKSPPASRSGSTIVEFALLLPLAVAIMGATFEMAWMFYQRALMSGAVQEGCQAGAAVNPAASPGPEETARTRIDSFLDDLRFRCGDCDVQVDSSSSSGMQVLDCSIQVSYSPILGLLPSLEGLPLSASPQVLLEFQP